MRRLIPLLLVFLLLLSGVAQGSIGFDPAQYEHQLKGEHFVLFYDTEGDGAVTPEYATEVLAHAERAYRRLVTDGGLRPPRVEPVPIQLHAAQAYEGGSVSYTDYGFDLAVAINPQMSDSFDLGDVVAHEVFHVLQASYESRQGQQRWATEGTAPLASLYTYPRDSAVVTGAFTGHLGQYYGAQGLSMKEEPYLSSLFWFWTAEQYGGVKYMARVMHWAEHVEWERAAQLAAIEGGAPTDTTFDKLWRSFMLALVDGRMPAGYKTDRWFSPKSITWTGNPNALTHGVQQSGMGALGHRYTYYEPLTLGAYAFDLVQIEHNASGAVDLFVDGDQRALEAYVIQPGQKLDDALADYYKRPRYGHQAVPPADPQTRGARVPVGSPVRLKGEHGDRTLLLLMRLGNWGHSAYAVRLEPAQSVAEVSFPAWGPLAGIKHPADSAGSPPALTDEELTALKANSYLAGLTSLKVDQVEQIDFVRIQLTVGDTSMRAGGKVIPLPVAVQKDAEGEVWFPAKPLALALGARVEGDRFWFGPEWVEADPGTLKVTSSVYVAPSYAIVKMVDGELMATASFFWMGGVGALGYGDTWEFTFPDPQPR